MNIKKELIKAGFKDQTSLTNDEEINFELWHDLPQSELGIASIRLRNFKGQNDVDITIYYTKSNNWISNRIYFDIILEDIEI